MRNIKDDYGKGRLKANPQARISNTASYTRRIRKCPACGQNHDEVDFFQFTPPVTIGGKQYDWSGYCPVTEQEIYLRFKDNQPHATSV